jgi:hypothetical protein
VHRRRSFILAAATTRRGALAAWRRGAAVPRRVKTLKQPKGGRVTPKQSGRYTPPVPRTQKVSPRIVPILMFTFLAVGFLSIVLNYVDVLPGGAKNTYLLMGLGFITAGFITATRYH